MRLPMRTIQERVGVTAVLTPNTSALVASFSLWCGLRTRAESGFVHGWQLAVAVSSRVSGMQEVVACAQVPFMSSRTG